MFPRLQIKEEIVDNSYEQNSCHQSSDDVYRSPRHMLPYDEHMGTPPKKFKQEIRDPRLLKHRSPISRGLAVEPKIEIKQEWDKKILSPMKPLFQTIAHDYDNVLHELFQWSPEWFDS